MVESLRLAGGSHAESYWPFPSSCSLGVARTPDSPLYTYDPAGARTAVSGSYARTGLPAATSANAVYDVANQLTSWNGGAVTNDANGNMTAQGGFTFTYNARNQLTTVMQGATTRGAYVADGLGRRVRRTVGSTVTRPVYDGWNVAQERAQNGTTIRANLLVGLGLDELFVRTDTAQREFLSDALGSTIALADTTGVVQTSYTYEPYGRTTVSGGSSTNPHQFTGRENDANGSLHLYNVRNRYYSPTLGRFLTQDPIGFAGGDANLYGYAGAAPSTRTDPTGLIDWPPIICPGCGGHPVVQELGQLTGQGIDDWVELLTDWWSLAQKDLEPVSRWAREEAQELIDWYRERLAGRNPFDILGRCVLGAAGVGSQAARFGTIPGVIGAVGGCLWGATGFPVPGRL